MKRYLHAVIFLFLLLAGFFITLFYADKIDGSDPYKPVPGAFQGLTPQEIRDKEQELEAAKDIDRHAEQEPTRGGSRTMMMEATAYCLTTPTFTGLTPRIGVVAVDPQIIPLYSQLWIEGYGEGTALDTGKEIKGNKIDVWLPSYQECVEWGRKVVKVEILE